MAYKFNPFTGNFDLVKSELNGRYGYEFIDHFDGGINLTTNTLCPGSTSGFSGTISGTSES